VETNQYISQKVRQDYENLMNFLLPFAKKSLRKRGGFHPFGAAIRVDGSMEAVAGYDDKENPDADELLSLLIDGLKDRAEELRAVGICRDVTVQIPGEPSEQNAVQICQDHSQGKPIDLFIMYRRGLLRRIRF
jgi:hypothetical protein